MSTASMSKLLSVISIPNLLRNILREPQGVVVFVVIFAFAISVSAQVSVTTYHNDNARTGQNLGESMLTPANVNVNQFAKLYAGNVTLDSWVSAQPLYVPNVTIPGQGTHNVVYVATINNSLYAFDADGGQQLWQANYGPPTPFDNLCTDSTFQVSPSKGAGIVGTPVVDQTAGVIYFVTKTGDGNSSPYALYLHQVDITTGFDEPGSPALILPPSGPTFMPEYQMNRPGLLLENGYIYVALGSTGCRGLTGFPKINNHGWILGYNTLSLSQTPYVFVTSPTTNNAGIWQSGGGLSTDPSGNIYIETADGIFDQNNGGSDYGLSVLKLSPQLELLDFFTPYNEGTVLEPNDLDLSSVGPLLLAPAGSDPVVVATGKAEEIYLLDTDHLGGFCSPSICNTSTGNINILQDVPPPSYLSGCLGEGSGFTCRYGTPSYWSNGATNYVYFSEVPGPLVSYTFNGSLFNSTPVKSPLNYAGAGSGSISANSTGSGIFWAVTWGNGQLGKNSGTLRAFDATNLQTQFYASNLVSGGRDTLGYVPSFVTPTIANGKVFVTSENQLLVYGLLPTLTPSAGNSQSGYVGTKLPVTLSVQALNSYTNQPVPGISITFKTTSGGTFSNPTAITDSTGTAKTSYTLPNKPSAITITASSTSSTATTFSETANAGPIASLTLISGGDQKGIVATTLPVAIAVSVKDPHNNVMADVPVSFTDNNSGGSFNPPTANTNALGQASTFYTLPTKATTITLTAITGTLQTKVNESSVAATAASLGYVSGNHQTEPPFTTLPVLLTVVAKDKYGNLVQGATVAYTDNGAGGQFSNTQVVTSGTGRASSTYTTGPNAGTVTITATISGVAPVTFTETVQ